MDCHEFYEKASKIASPPGGSQNPDTYYALKVKRT